VKRRLFDASVEPILPLAVTMGDPAGCGPQITCAAWKSLRTSDTAFYVVSDPSLYEGIPVELIASPREAKTVFSEALPVLASQMSLPEIHSGNPSPDTATATLASIETAVSHALSGQAGGVVTNPISKALLYAAGFKHPGHTEFLAELCRSENPTQKIQPIMMLVGGGLRVALATIHVPLSTVSDLLTQELLIETATIVHKDLQTRFSLSQPRLAFTGLNPHAGEGGSIGIEEIETINPAAQKLRDQGISICNARPADTVFHEALQGDYDAVIAMTHDQGLIPVKTLDMWGGVNTTLGLPIIRTSPDHGTAYDAAAKGTARPDSLIAAIKLASQMAIEQTA